MADLNSINLTGRLCSDPELKYTPSGVAVVNMRIAVNRVKEREGQKADFINLNVWSQAAEFAAEHLHKGDQVGITGRLEIRQWVAQDGTKRNSPEVQVGSLYSMGKSTANQERPPDAPPPATGGGPSSDEDFNDPFADQ